MCAKQICVVILFKFIYFLYTIDGRCHTPLLQASKGALLMGTDSLGLRLLMGPSDLSGSLPFLLPV